MNHPAIEPFASGLLRVGDGTDVYWEASGRRDGKPALFLHGGPGSTLEPDRLALSSWRVSATA